VLPSFLTRHQEDHLDHSVQWIVWEGEAADKAEALWIVWEGEAADKAEALKCAEKADPRVDLEWMRIRYERDLNKGRTSLCLMQSLLPWRKRHPQRAESLVHSM
jgi:hypothetical protein